MNKIIASLFFGLAFISPLAASEQIEDTYLDEFGNYPVSALPNISAQESKGQHTYIIDGNEVTIRLRWLKGRYATLALELSIKQAQKLFEEARIAFLESPEKYIFSLSGIPGSKKQYKAFITSTPIDKSTQTKNQMGEIVLETNYLIQKFQDFVTEERPAFASNLFSDSTVSRRVLDIGGAVGHNVEKFLKYSHIHVILNDLDPRHFHSMYYKYCGKENLWLNHQRFPDQMEQEENSLDAVLVSHLFHYLTPEQIILGLNKVHSWLKVDGRIFIQALTPYSAPFSFYRYAFENEKENGNPWPGFIENMEEAYKTLWNYEYAPKNFPKTVHPMDIDTLTRVLEEANFKIEFINYANFHHPKDVHSFPPDAYGMTREDLESSSMDISQEAIDWIVKQQNEHSLNRRLYNALYKGQEKIDDDQLLYDFYRSLELTDYSRAIIAVVATPLK